MTIKEKVAAEIAKSTGGKSIADAVADEII
jgi:hypothetical protein